MFHKLLVANRGEIAVRVLRTAKEMGLGTVAVYSEADRLARHVTMADESYLLGPAAPAASYLNVEKLLEICKRSGADAVHPGYGFLAESAKFARAVVAAKLTWVGPHAAAIDAMGDKVRARQTMVAAGVPVVPGGTQPIADAAGAVAAAREFGLPLALKAAGGGGGKGLKVARTADEIEGAFRTAQREAAAYFQDGTIYAERYLENPKHVELQVLADKHGHVVHVGERDCSLQRRHQKLWEETPAHIPSNVRDAMRAAGVQAAQTIGYDSAGTIECLVSGDRFYFLEMNTRIQVEHTVSEMVSGLDLIREQIRIAAGEPLGYGQEAIRLDGHSIEGRVNAEDPLDNFRPAPGMLTAYQEPGGPGVRVDSAAYPGYSISADYDSLLAKLVVWAPTRERALERLRRAIGEFKIEGVPTTLALLRALIDHPQVADSSYGTATLERFAATAFAGSGGSASQTATTQPQTSEVLAVEVNDKLFRVRILDAPEGGPRLPAAPRRPKQRKMAAGAGNDISAPMHGVVVEVQCGPGQSVKSGQVVAIIEAMKMMNEIRAHRDGVVAAVHAVAGGTIEADSPLVTLE
ncbi:MAG: carbamoyl phosphate synthase [Candidatus Meridianibacter frigidus]|nr:MAG: carbamoyl phosphate synthase [Candidatus Eremiobacteraeota bacterium]